MKKIYIILITLILILFGAVFQNIAMFRTGMSYSYGIGYWGPLARDGVWHEALVAQLNKHISPQNPGLAGNALINYHYYYDLTVSLIHHLGIPSNILIYIILPIIFSVLLGIGTYKLADVLFENKFVSILSVFFAYFASSFGWVVSLLKGQAIAGESDFWANQPVSMNLNPPYAISLVMIIFIILFVNSYLKRSTFIKAFFIIILSGTLIEFKVYAGAILLGGLFVLAIKRLYFNRDFKLIIISIFSIILSLIVFIPQNKQSLGLIEVNPFWLVNTMIDAGDRVGIASLSSKRFTYQESHQYIKFAAVEAIGFLIFFIGNLGTRIVGLFGLKRKQLTSDIFIFIFAMMLASFIPVLIFTQKGNPWNIIQFFYYFLYFVGLFSAFALRKANWILVTLIILITPISSISTFRGWFYTNPPAYLSSKEYQALKYLSAQPDGIVLKHPFDPNMRSQYKDPFPIAVYADNSYVSAFSGKTVFIEDAEQQIVLNTNYRTRLDDADRFFIEKDLKWSSKFLEDNNIKYIYLPKIYHLPMAEQEYPMRKIFENEDVKIYDVIK